jgi:hypothetical protein
MNADLMVVAHSELAGCKLGGSSFLCIPEGKLLILLEYTFVPKKEPPTDAQSSFWRSLFGG